MIKPERKRAWHAWHNMIRRCYNPKAVSYHRYGSRGIEVCQRWLANFDNFIEDMGPAPDGLSLERIDNDGNYSPDNCKWASREEQSANTSRTTKITFKGKTKSLRGWAREIGISHTQLASRLKTWSLDEALTTPYRMLRHCDER